MYSLRKTKRPNPIRVRPAGGKWKHDQALFNTKNREVDLTIPQKLSKNFEQFVRITSFHGIKHYETASSFVVRVLWLLIMVLMICLFCYQISTLLQHLFLDRSSRIHYEEKTELEMELPDVTLCSSGPLSLKAVLGMQRKTGMKFNKSEISYMTLPWLYFMMNINFLNDTQQHRDLQSSYERFMKAYGRALVDLYNELSITCVDIILYCQMPNILHLEGRECCDRYFQSPVLTIYGKCYSSHGVKVKQRYFGPYSKLKLGLRFSANKWMDGHIVRYFTEEVLFPIYLNNADSVAFVAEADVFARPGYRTAVRLSKQQKDFSNVRLDLSSSRFSCFPNPSDDASLEEIALTYLENCPGIMAWIDRISSKHGCIPMIFPRNVSESHDWCQPKDVIALLREQEIEIWKFEEYCSHPCVKFLYKTEVFESNIGRDYVEEVQVKYNLAPGDLLTEVEFSFPNFKESVYVFEATTMSSLLGIIGGNLGLTVGGSLISILEIIVLLFQCIFVILCRS